MKLSVLRAAAQCFGLTEAAAGPVAPQKPAAEYQPRIEAYSRLAAPLSSAMTTMNLADALLARSPLTGQDNLDAKTIDKIAGIYRDNRVQRAAAEARHGIVRAIEFASYRSLIGAAISAAGDSATPEHVAGVLRHLGEQAEAALVDAREDQAAHDRIEKQRRDVLMPLRTAVSERLNKLQTELNALANRAEALRRAPTSHVTSAEERKLLMQAAGLTSEQIAAVSIGTAGPTREEQREQTQARIAEVKAAMVPLQRFAETADDAVLEGLGFDDLIAARRAAEKVAM